MSWRGAEPTLTTERLRLRAFRRSDLPDMASIDADPEVTYFRGIAPRSEQESRQRLAQCLAARRHRNRSTLEWCVREAVSDTFVGLTLLRVVNREWRTWEIGYALARHAWGNGYATEAVRTTLEFAFQRLDAHRLIANAYPENTGSHRVLAKLGFREEGYEVASYFEHGAWQDNKTFALLRTEFQPQVRH